MGAPAVGLFAGIGGLEIGLEKHGWRTELLCEIDPSTLSFDDFIETVRLEVERRNQFAPTWADDDESDSDE